MKKISLIALIILLAISGYCQEFENSKFRLGLKSSVDKIYSLKLDGHPTFWNFGLIGEYQLSTNWVFHLNVTHSIRNYETMKSGITTPLTARYGISASYSSSVKEKQFEVENLIKYQFLSQKNISPFLGIGYAIQFPYCLEGERTIVHDDELGIFDGEESLGFPGELSSYINFGLYSNLGVNFSFFQRIDFVIDLGYKWYFGSNLSIYGYPHPDEPSNRHDSLNFNFGILYEIK